MPQLPTEDKMERRNVINQFQRSKYVKERKDEVLTQRFGQEEVTEDLGESNYNKEKTAES